MSICIDSAVSKYVITSVKFVRFKQIHGLVNVALTQIYTMVCV